MRQSQEVNWGVTIAVWVAMLLLIGILVTLIIIAVGISNLKGATNDVHKALEMIGEIVECFEQFCPAPVMMAEGVANVGKNVGANAASVAFGRG